MWKTGGHVCRNGMCEVNYWRRVMSEEIWVMLAWCLCTWALFACLLHTVYSHMHDFICMYVCARVSEERRQKLQHVPPAMFLIITVWVCACTPFFLDVSIMSNLAEKQNRQGKASWTLHMMTALCCHGDLASSLICFVSLGRIELHESMLALTFGLPDLPSLTAVCPN